MGLFDFIARDILGIKPPEVKQASLLTGNQQELEELLSGLAQQGIGQPGRVFPGEFSPGPSQLQQGAFDQFPGQVGQSTNQFNQLLGQGTISGEQLFGPAREQALRLFERDIAPNILGRFAQTGSANSGGARRALSEAGGDLSLGLGALLAQIQSQQAGRQLQGAQLAGQPLNFLGQQANLGGQQRGIESEQLLGQRQQFDLADPTRSPSAQLGLGLLGGNFAQPFLQQGPGVELLKLAGNVAGTAAGGGFG